MQTLEQIFVTKQDIKYTLEELYTINEDGSVVNNASGNVMTPRIATNAEYIQYGLCDGTRLYAHRLVALKYISLVDGKECVNHKDGNRQNNHMSNLEWCTHQENIFHQVAMSRGYSGSFENSLEFLRMHYTELLENADIDIDDMLLARFGVNRGWLSGNGSIEPTEYNKVLIDEISRIRTYYQAIRNKKHLGKEFIRNNYRSKWFIAVFGKMTIK